MIHQRDIKKTKKCFKKRLVNGIKIFLKNKKSKKWKYGRERYKSRPEDEKESLVKYRKSIIKYVKRKQLHK